MKSREPSAGNRLWAPALSLIQIFRSHARAQARTRVRPALAARLLAMREMLPARSFPGSALRNRGWGFGAKHKAKRPTTMGSHAENFFRPFDFVRYSPMTYRGKSNAHAGW